MPLNRFQLIRKIMKNKKGFIILMIIVAVALLALVKKAYTKISGNIYFSSQAFDSEEDFSEDSYDDFNDQQAGPLNKIISISLDKKNEDKGKSLKKPYVSVIYITGVISEENRTYNQKWLLKKIKNAKNDPNNRGILLNVNSPGGTVYESDEAYLALKEYKTATQRPVFAFFGSLAASGGYYISCAADTIFANRNTLTGSIGVIAGQSVDATAFLDKVGIKMTTITAGRNKNMGNYNSVLTEEQQAIMQSIADEAYEQFTEIVAESRKMKIEDVKPLADGRIYTAAQAKSNGLIDEICPLEEAKSKINEILSKGGNENGKKSEAVTFIDYKYHYEETWMSLISGAVSFIKNPEASVYEWLGNSPKCLYLYQ